MFAKNRKKLRRINHVSVLRKRLQFGQIFVRNEGASVYRHVVEIISSRAADVEITHFDFRMRVALAVPPRCGVGFPETPRIHSIRRAVKRPHGIIYAPDCVDVYVFFEF